MGKTAQEKRHLSEKWPLGQEDRQWLAELQKEVWKHHEDPKSRIRWGEAKRELTEPEITRVWQIVERHGLPCVMSSMNFGFGVGLVIYDHSPVPEVKPEPIISVSGDHRPGGKTRQGPTFSDDFDYFSRFTHNDGNKQVLAFYGFEAPQSKSYYDY